MSAGDQNTAVRILTQLGAALFFSRQQRADTSPYSHSGAHRYRHPGVGSLASSRRECAFDPRHPVHRSPMKYTLPAVFPVSCPYYGAVIRAHVIP